MRYLRRFNEDANDSVAEAAQYIKELLREFGDEIVKTIEIDRNNNLSVLIRPPRRSMNTLEDLKTGNYIMIGEEYDELRLEFVERLQSIALMLNEELRLVNIFEITWTKVTKKGNRTRRRTQVDKKYIPKMVKELKDKPIHEVRITAGKPVR